MLTTVGWCMAFTCVMEAKMFTIKPVTDMEVLSLLLPLNVDISTHYYLLDA